MILFANDNKHLNIRKYLIISMKRKLSAIRKTIAFSYVITHVDCPCWLQLMIVLPDLLLWLWLRCYWLWTVYFLLVCFWETFFSRLCVADVSSYHYNHFNLCVFICLFFRFNSICSLTVFLFLTIYYCYCLYLYTAKGSGYGSTYSRMYSGKAVLYLLKRIDLWKKILVWIECLTAFTSRIRSKSAFNTHTHTIERPFICTRR